MPRRMTSWRAFSFTKSSLRGLALTFWIHFSRISIRCYLYAGIHRVLFGSHRCVASRFPFAIYYRIEGEVIRVRAVIDCRRNPTWIRRRIKE